MILKEKENLQGTGGYTITQNRKNSKTLWIEFWGVYGNKKEKITIDEAKEKEWL